MGKLMDLNAKQHAAMLAMRKPLEERQMDLVDFYTRIRELENEEPLQTIPDAVLYPMYELVFKLLTRQLELMETWSKNK